MSDDSDNVAIPGRGAGGSLRGAWIWAGAKVTIGLLVLCAVLGVRMASIDSSESSGDSSAVVDAEREEEPKAITDDDVNEGESQSMLARLSERAKESLPGSRGPDEGSRLVSCRLSKGMQFMTAADCAVRGGQAAKTFEASAP